jgi:multisubunit Na+/H+ antiporter MnhB subunit
MKTRRLLLLAIVVLCGLLLVGNALAMRSENYWLDWFTPLTGGGGGPVNSANYAANFTVGQSVIGAADSANYAIGLGYWYGTAGGYRIYLPLMMRSSS